MSAGADELNKAMVIEAFDMLFNRRDYHPEDRRAP